MAITDQDIKNIQLMATYSDTAAAVTSASRVEDWLGGAIKAKMRSDLSSTLSDRLFKHYGPLKTFSGKIDIAYAFSIIDTETFGDLKAIKDIRNKFAHSTKIVQFSNPEVRPLIQKLSGWTAEAKQIDLFLDRCKACVDKFKPLVKSEPVAPDSDD